MIQCWYFASHLNYLPLLCVLQDFKAEPRMAFGWCDFWQILWHKCQEYKVKEAASFFPFPATIKTSYLLPVGGVVFKAEVGKLRSNELFILSYLSSLQNLLQPALSSKSRAGYHWWICHFWLPVSKRLQKRWANCGPRATYGQRNYLIQPESLHTNFSKRQINRVVILIG